MLTKDVVCGVLVDAEKNQPTYLVEVHENKPIHRHPG
jgi:hypothetical protein